MPKKETTPTETTVARVEDALHDITREEMVQKTGIDLPAPDGAENVSYHVLMASSDKPIAQMKFTLDGHTAYLRAQATDFVPEKPGIDAKPEELASLLDTDHYDISGLYYKWRPWGAPMWTAASACTAWTRTEVSSPGLMLYRGSFTTSAWKKEQIRRSSRILRRLCSFRFREKRSKKLVVFF